jgi:small subunit ribosomal protein S15
MLSSKAKKDIIKEISGKAENTGMTESQIALLTADIKNITNHMQANKKDASTKRGLYKKVSQRHALLNYLKRVDIERYREILKKLDLRGQ